MRMKTYYSTACPNGVTFDIDDPTDDDLIKAYPNLTPELAKAQIKTDNPNWPVFEEWVQGALFAKIIDSTQAAMVNLLLHEIFTQHYDGLRNQILFWMSLGKLSFEKAERIALNKAVEDYGIRPEGSETIFPPEGD